MQMQLISSLHLSKLTLEGNLYFGPLETILRILEIIFKLSVIICHNQNKNSAQKHKIIRTATFLMEKLQYRALRLVFNDFPSSYESLLDRIKMPTLHISRIRLIALETFKILHKLTPVYLQDLVSYKNSAYSFRYENLVDLPRVRTTKYGKSSSCYEAAVVWNSLPNELRMVEDFTEFKRLVHTWSGPACKCLCVKVDLFSVFFF